MGPPAGEYLEAGNWLSQQSIHFTFLCLCYKQRTGSSSSSFIAQFSVKWDRPSYCRLDFAHFLWTVCCLTILHVINSRYLHEVKSLVLYDTEYSCHKDSHPYSVLYHVGGSFLSVSTCQGNRLKAISVSRLGWVMWTVCGLITHSKLHTADFAPKLNQRDVDPCASRQDARGVSVFAGEAYCIATVGGRMPNQWYATSWDEKRVLQVCVCMRTCVCVCVLPIFTWLFSCVNVTDSVKL